MSKDVPPVSFDNVSFYSEESVTKWKFVFHRRLATQRELSADAQKCNEIIELLSELLGTLLRVFS